MAMRGMTPLCSALGRGEQKRALSTRKKSGKKQGLAGTRMTRMKSGLCTPRRSQGRAHHAHQGTTVQVVCLIWSDRTPGGGATLLCAGQPGKVSQPCLA